ncbi:unnamed protein product [Malus baccata var. baccata]
MEALVALRLKVKKIDQYGSRSKRHNNSAVHLTSNKSSADDNLGNEPTGLTSGLQVNEEHRREPSTGGSEVNPNHVKNSSSDGRELLKTYTQKENPMEVLEHVRITNTLESLISTIKGVFKDSREEELSFDKEELKRVEERLRAAFIQFYHQLQLLKHYSFMNLSAFSKIMKKYEKCCDEKSILITQIAARRAARSYMLIVDNSNVGSSDEHSEFYCFVDLQVLLISSCKHVEEVTNLLERVETTFIQKFSNSNRREGMKSLRPKAKRERHSVTFFSGFFSGCSIALLVAIVFPLYRVNYAFIFGFKKGTELGYLEVFLLATGLAVLSLGGFLANLHLDLSAEKYKTVTELVPLVLLAETFPDFFLADQLTSQVQALRSFVLYVCYYGLGESSRRLITHIFHAFIPSISKLILFRINLKQNGENGIENDCFLLEGETRQTKREWKTDGLKRRIINGQREEEARKIKDGGTEKSGETEGDRGDGQKQGRKEGSAGRWNKIGKGQRWRAKRGRNGGVRKKKGQSTERAEVRGPAQKGETDGSRHRSRGAGRAEEEPKRCIRRFCDEKDVKYICNGLKYLSTIVAVIIRTVYEMKKGKTSWMVLALISSAVATTMNTYLDIVMDWGLLRKTSRNKHRDKFVDIEISVA